MTDQKINQKQTELEKLIKDNPSVPAEIFDIEESQEVAELYADMFGYN